MMAQTKSRPTAEAAPAVNLDAEFECALRHLAVWQLRLSFDQLVGLYAVLPRLAGHLDAGDLHGLIAAIVPSDELLGVPEVARRLRVTEQTARNWVGQHGIGEFSAVERRYRISRNRLRDFLLARDRLPADFDH